VAGKVKGSPTEQRPSFAFDTTTPVWLHGCLMRETKKQLPLSGTAPGTGGSPRDPIPANSRQRATPLDPEFLADCPYQPAGVLLEEIVEIDKERSLVRARMFTRPDLPLTCFQRVDPVRHPHHVNGALLVRLTGMLGFVHAYYVLGLRYREGWIGLGALIHKARYPNMALIGKPLDLRLQATNIREGDKKKVVTYDFLFTQDGTAVYQSTQTALWLHIP
jgi:hypothetical protein